MPAITLEIEAYLGSWRRACHGRTLRDWHRFPPRARRNDCARSMASSKWRGRGGSVDRRGRRSGDSGGQCQSGRAGRNGLPGRNTKRFEGGHLRVASRSHRLARALMNPSMLAFAATARAWWETDSASSQHVAGLTEGVDGQSMSTTQLAPSVSIPLPEVSDARQMPGCVRMSGRGRGSTTRISRPALHMRRSAAQATLTPVVCSQFSLSADVGYRWSRPSINGFEPRQIGFSLSGHWYAEVAPGHQKVRNQRDGFLSHSFACSVSLSCVRRTWRPESSTQQEGDICHDTPVQDIRDPRSESSSTLCVVAEGRAFSQPKLNVRATRNPGQGSQFRDRSTPKSNFNTDINGVPDADRLLRPGSALVDDHRRGRWPKPAADASIAHLSVEVAPL